MPGFAMWPELNRRGKRPTPDSAERRNGERGFTLVELLVVMAILVMIAGLVTPRVIGYLGKSRVKAAKIQIESVATSLELYRLDVGGYPSTNQGLSALLARPENVTNWNGPYLRANALPVDPWGEPFHYRSPGRAASFEIFSLGADRKQNGDGENQDITSW